MWPFRNAFLVAILALLLGCKGKREMSSSAEQEASEAVESFSLPKVMELKVEGDYLYVRLRLNGKCDTHQLEWMEQGDCRFEVRDLTTTDKCMGYQFVEEKIKKNSSCETMTINGTAYSV